MKVLILWPFYPEYLAQFYAGNSGLFVLPFEEHRRALLDDRVGWPVDMSRYMSRLGITVEFYTGNDERLQKKWATENGFNTYRDATWEKDIALEQVRRFRPDILWIPSYFAYYGEFVVTALSYARRAITWVGSPFRGTVDVTGFSALLTENPDTFRTLQSRFRKVIVTKPGFDPDIASVVGACERDLDITFSGQISAHHKKRAEYLAYLLENGIKVVLHGMLYDPEMHSGTHGVRDALWYTVKGRDLRLGMNALGSALWPSSYQRHVDVLRMAVRAPVFGLEMYRLLARSLLTLNIHIDVASNNAGNMRMFEATGVGACLVTERARNLGDLFTPEEEVLTYQSKQELYEVVRRALAERDKTRTIAARGQKRTLEHHTLARMWRDIAPAFES